jgi:hypothetical protein
MIVYGRVQYIQRRQQIGDRKQQIKPAERLAKKITAVDIRQIRLNEREKFVLHYFVF